MNKLTKTFGIFTAIALTTGFVWIQTDQVIVLAVQHAFAAKAIVPEPNLSYTESNAWALRAASSLVEEDLASLSYLSRLNKCFDMPFSELASCRNALRERYGQTQ